MKPGYKQTEVGVIPKDWEVKPFGSIANIERGKFSARPRNDPKYYGGDIPFLQTGDIAKANGIIRSFSQTLNARGLRVSKVFPHGTLFFTIAANIGDVGIATFDAACPDSIVGIRSKSGTDISWLAYQLTSKKSGFEQIATTTTQLNVNLEKLRPYLLVVPPTVAEQRAIADALGDADALIESLERLIAKKRAIKQGAMQELLTGHRRLPGFKGEWETKQLGELLTICHGKSQHEVELQDGPYPILATGGQIGTASHYLYDKPSVLIGRKGTIDQPQYMDSPFWTVDTLFYSIIHDANDAKYIYYRFCLINWRQYNEASGVPSMNAHTIENIEIECPSPAEQTAIANVLSDMDAEIAALEGKLGKARAIKQGMMQELLTGRIRLV